MSFSASSEFNHWLEVQFTTLWCLQNHIDINQIIVFIHLVINELDRPEVKCNMWYRYSLSSHSWGAIDQLRIFQEDIPPLSTSPFIINVIYINIFFNYLFRNCVTSHMFYSSLMYLPFEKWSREWTCSVDQWPTVSGGLDLGKIVKPKLGLDYWSKWQRGDVLP